MSIELKKSYTFEKIIIIVLSVIGIGVLLFFLFKKNKDNDKDNDKHNDNIDAYKKWINDNIVTVGDLSIPKSYNPGPDYYMVIKPSSYYKQKLKHEDRYNSVIEEHNQTHGINIYDASLWVIIQARQKQFNAPCKWLKYLGIGTGNLQDQNNLMGTKLNSPYAYKWVYGTHDQDWPDGEFGDIGFNIRLASTVGYEHETNNRFYRISNESDGGGYPNSNYELKTPPDDYDTTSDGITYNSVNKLKVTWSDYRPVGGENAWSGLIGPMHLLYQGTVKNKNVLIPEQITDIFSYTRRIVLTFEKLLFSDGGVYYSPQPYKQGNFDTTFNLWNTLQFSTENMASATAGLTMVWNMYKNDSIKDRQNIADKALEIRNKIINFVVNKCTKVSTADLEYKFNIIENLKPPYIIASGTCALTKNAVLDGADFALDVHTWGVSVMCDEIEKKPGAMDNACYELWKQSKKQTGYIDKDNNFAGVGYTKSLNNDILSGEWTSGAINMCKILAGGIYKDNPTIQKDLLKDADIMLKSIKNNLDDKNSILYANKRYSIPFGWMANPNPSLASTAWYIFNMENFNPFRLDGAFLSSTSESI